jgi:hypothetical protein
MNLKAVTKNWAFVFATILPLKPNDFCRRCKLCLSLEELCLPLSNKMQWLAMLQNLEGQAFLEMPECIPSTNLDF